MAKTLFKTLVVVGLMLGISNYMLYIMTGKTPSWADVEVPELSFEAPSMESLSNPTQQDTVYKWVDEHGVTQYSSEPPPEHIQASTLDIHPEVNVIQGLPAKETATEVQATAATTIPTPQAPSSVYSPESVKKLVDDAKHVQQMLNERYQSIEDINDPDKNSR